MLVVRTDLRRVENHMEFKCDKKNVGQRDVLEEPELEIIISVLQNFWPDPDDNLCKCVKEFRNFSCFYKWDLEALGSRSVMKSNRVPYLQKPLEYVSGRNHRRM